MEKGYLKEFLFWRYIRIKIYGVVWSYCPLDPIDFFFESKKLSPFVCFWREHQPWGKPLYLWALLRCCLILSSVSVLVWVGWLVCVCAIAASPELREKFGVDSNGSTSSFMLIFFSNQKCCMSGKFTQGYTKSTVQN